MKTAFLILGFAAGAFAQKTAIEVIHVRGNVYMFASDRGNVTVQVGQHKDLDGVMLVDTGPADMAPQIVTEVKKLTSKPIRFLANTGPDVDHVGGNVVLGKPGQIRETGGPQAAEINIYSHDKALARLSAKGSGVPEQGWPTMTFEQQKDFTFNGEAVQMFPEGPAHTDGDSIVFFRGSNVISTGEIFTTTGYPVIDLARGGSIQGEIRALNHIIDLTVPEITQEGGTMVIPGHGRLCDEADVVEFRDMVTIIRDRVADFIKRGKSMEEAKAAKLTVDYDLRYSKPGWTGEMFVESIYKSLKQSGSQGK